MRLQHRYPLFLILISILSCNHTSNNSHSNNTISTVEDVVVSESQDVQRYGMVIELKKDKIKEYKELHANAWPGVLEQLTESNIQNYSIYLQEIEGKHYLFSYFEYTGNNYEQDMKKMAADSVTQEWWKYTDSYQKPLDSRQEGEWWTTMEEVFHHE